MSLPEERASVSLGEIAREWGRIGCLGFGGPPVHIALLRELCVQRRGWLSADQFERGLAAANILPGPSSTQLAIYCAWRLGGRRGALVGGLGFILPGLAAIIALSALFLTASTPTLLRAIALGAGAAVAAVAVRAGLTIALPTWARASAPERPRVLVYALSGAAGAAAVGPWLVLVLLACGAAELARRRLARGWGAVQGWLALASVGDPGGTAALAWTALKVGALSFGGGFVIVPLMQSDAVGNDHWMTHAQFLTAVALGQVTPGPLVQTVAAVGYAAGGVPSALLAAAIAFAPSFSFVLLGAARYERLLGNERVSAFIAGAAPAAAGAIVGSAIPLALAIGQSWQYLVLAGAAFALFALRRGVVATLLVAGAAGALAGLLGAPLGG